MIFNKSQRTVKLNQTCLNVENYAEEIKKFDDGNEIHIKLMWINILYAVNTGFSKWNFFFNF